MNFLGGIFGDKQWNVVMEYEIIRAFKIVSQNFKNSDSEYC